MTEMHPRRMGNKRGKPEMDRFTITHHILLMRYSNRVVLAVEEIAEDYLGLATSTAKRKAALGTLPFPVFQLGDSIRSPYVVHLDDLAKHIDKRCAEAEAMWKMLGISR
ncbi:pyocin activator PrtN family protein [Vibrio hibernica]|uniref:pyocin activator PrtN family protein n=1 Tax=Vibrio hibernica TaxID=2587465 RepID=UPI0039B07EA1